MMKAIVRSVLMGTLLVCEWGLNATKSKQLDVLLSSPSLKLDKDVINKVNTLELFVQALRGDQEKEAQQLKEQKEKEELEAKASKIKRMGTLKKVIERLGYPAQPMTTGDVSPEQLEKEEKEFEKEAYSALWKEYVLPPVAESFSEYIDKRIDDYNKRSLVKRQFHYTIPLTKNQHYIIWLGIDRPTFNKTVDVGKKKALIETAYKKALEQLNQQKPFLPADVLSAVQDILVLSKDALIKGAHLLLRAELDTLREKREKEPHSQLEDTKHMQAAEHMRVEEAHRKAEAQIEAEAAQLREDKRYIFDRIQLVFGPSYKAKEWPASLKRVEINDLFAVLWENIEKGFNYIARYYNATLPKYPDAFPSEREQLDFYIKWFVQTLRAPQLQNIIKEFGFDPYTQTVATPEQLDRLRDYVLERCKKKVADIVAQSDGKLKSPKPPENLYAGLRPVISYIIPREDLEIAWYLKQLGEMKKSSK